LSEPGWDSPTAGQAGLGGVASKGLPKPERNGALGAALDGQAEPIEAGRPCRAHVIKPLFVKQFGNRHALAQGWKSAYGADPAEWPAWARIQEFRCLATPALRST
jgi:hypothetical protein